MRSLQIEILTYPAIRNAYSELVHAHALCFPVEHSEEAKTETVDEFFARVTWLHEEQDATWFLLWESDANVPSNRTLIAFACGYSYADSWYGSHLGVIPWRRGQGYGSYLMRISQHHASRLGIRRLQASVEVDPKVARATLLRYYERHGARIVETGIGSTGAIVGSVVRIQRHFTPKIAQQELAASERHIRGGLIKRWRVFSLIILVAVQLGSLRKSKDAFAR